MMSSCWYMEEVCGKKYYEVWDTNIIGDYRSHPVLENFELAEGENLKIEEGDR